MSDITRFYQPRYQIESIIQKPPPRIRQGPVVVLTHVAPQSVLTDALNEIMALEEVDADAALMRVEAFDR